MNVTVKHIRGTTCPLICETTCLVQWEPSWQQQRIHRFLGGLDWRIYVWKVSWDMPAYKVWFSIHQVYLNLEGGGYFPSLKSALKSVGNYFPLLVNLFITNNGVPPWCKADKEEKTWGRLQMQSTVVLEEGQRSWSLPWWLCQHTELCLN